MASYSDFGIFLPKQEYFKGPGEYEAALRAQSLEKASYLSTMDQYYAGLEETKREFDIGMGFKREELAENIRVTERGQDIGRAVSMAQLASAERISAAEAASRERISGGEIASREKIAERGFGIEESQFGEELAFKEKSLETATGLELSQMAVNIALADISGQYGVSQAEVGNETDLFDWVMGGALVAGSIL